jgi:protoheme IX farnesyltransferase
MDIIRDKLRSYWNLIKSPQTCLLLITGLAGYMSSRCPVLNWSTLLALGGSLLLAISGSTVINMWHDRDIDACMARTCTRPLPSGQVSAQEAFWLGLALSIAGLGWALVLDALYGIIILAGLFLDVVVYTLWLKRRTAWSIVWGGLSGGMPALAGRALGIGVIDWLGICLALAVLFWIPTHIMTFSMRYHQDYQVAGVPTFPARYGFPVTRAIIALSSLLATLAMGVTVYGIGVSWGFLRLFTLAAFGLFALAAISVIRPSARVNFGLFKYASVYMLCAMLLLLFTGI